MPGSSEELRLSANTEIFKDQEKESAKADESFT
jgi:hypothetical protein